MIGLLMATTWAVGGYEVSLLPYAVVVTAGLILFIPVILFRKWYFYRKRIKKSVITVDYEPPAKLTPAEMQYLFGGINQERIVAATIIHLVQRGYMHMRKVDGKKMLFIGPKEGGDLQHFEKMLLAQVDKPNGIDPVSLLRQPIPFASQDVDAKRTTALKFSDHILESLRDRNLIKGKGANKFFANGVQVAALLLFALIWWPIMLFWFTSVLEASSSDFSSIVDFLRVAGIITAISLLPILVLAVFIVKWRSQLIGRRWMSSAKLNKLWPQVMGYRHFVKLSEKGKLKFDSNELQKSSSKEVLAYAVALGFVKNWRDIVS